MFSAAITTLKKMCEDDDVVTTVCTW